MPLDYTVCITNFKRPDHLRRCLQSCERVPRVVVASYGDETGELETIVRETRPGTPHVAIADDFGCNALWMQAVAMATTEWVVILHDDDQLAPEFHATLAANGHLLKDHAFLAWRGDGVQLDGPKAGAKYPVHAYGRRPSGPILTESYATSLHSTHTGLAISPVTFLIRRDVALRTLSWCAEHLEDCCTRPGMMVGNDLALFLANLRSGRKFYYLDRPLVRYGAWSGSETIAWSEGRNPQLVERYNLARTRFTGAPLVSRTPIQIIHATTSRRTDGTPEPRFHVPLASWQRFYRLIAGEAEELVAPMRFPNTDFTRTSKTVGDDRAVPFIRDVIERAVSAALKPGDIILFTNDDIAVDPEAMREALLDLWNADNREVEAAVFHRRDFDAASLAKVGLGSLSRELTPAEVKLGRWHAGLDAVAFTRRWWEDYGRPQLPDFLIGCEGWDWAFRRLIEFYYKQAGLDPKYARHKNVIYHVPHDSFWERPANRLRNKGNLYNRALTKAFLLNHGVYCGGFEPNKAEVHSDFCEPEGCDEL